MIIRLNQSDLFKTDPARRFAREYQVSEDVWKQLWKRYKHLEYTDAELCEVFLIKVGRPIGKRGMNRWMFRGEIYALTRPMIDKGVQNVTSKFFGKYEQRVVNIILDKMRAGVTRDSRIMA
jgi:hypothetical protein